jgi:hypothetical protein
MRKSPAQVYAFTFGLVLLLAGILGFFYTADFSTGDATKDPGNRDALIGIFDVNGWHNVVHVLSGLAGLALAGSWRGARLYAWGFGLTYLAVTVIGFVVGDDDSIFGLLAINTEDNFLHLAISLLGIMAALASPSAPAPTTVEGGRKSKAFVPSVRRRAQGKNPVERKREGAAG